MIPNAYVGLGSNLGDRAGNLLLAVRGILEAGMEITRLSPIYETEAISNLAQPDFLNQVAELRGKSLPTPEQMLARLLRVEYALGRTRDIPDGPRTIDLDLLFYKGETRDTEFLKVPHPRLHLRRFVLTPLNDLVPNLLHPTIGATIGDLLQDLDDESRITRWSPS
ncbi:MAG TPA: 2-amino-4-hydroxy-6-hydroxymethyldihydropteridine diphosphokinase [Pyrinomonadaceae bacterium]|nr:2-amino-4-hydroxy-6-hydroxymethyldihydropteridine diphosphokinase [Pyrinomonadaceae bacterium]